MTLYHYTCSHGCQALGETGVLRTAADLAAGKDMPWTAKLIWLTDLDVPFREALGLTSYSLGCDRTYARYRVTDESDARRWVRFRRGLPGALELEEAPGAMPMHWWVSLKPVPVVFDGLTA